jgi:hypothetical protein
MLEGAIMKKVLTTLIILALTSLTNSQNKSGWLTYFEKSNFFGSPDYATTMEYFQKLTDASENADFIAFGVSPQGRELKALIAAKGKAFTPQLARKQHKSIILIENGIHSGEIEGKDASMLLLREILITKEKENLLDSSVIIVVPIFNVDGHERRSPYNRINQNGPTVQGWRVTAQNLNLNRDFTKADTPEMKALLHLYNYWLPDMFIDTHTTDGADYQYTITYGVTKHKNFTKLQRNWARNVFSPFVESEVTKAGYLIAPYSYPIADNFSNGIADWVPSPRYSHGYAAVRNRFGLLIETHMLKPFKDRVFATKALLEAVIKLFNSKAARIISINKKADAEIMSKYSAGNYFPIRFMTSHKIGKPFVWKGYKAVKSFGKIAGDSLIEYIHQPIDIPTTYYELSEITDSVIIPDAYLVPQEWSKLIEILKIHSVKFKRVDKDQKIIADRYKFSNVKFPPKPYEGHFSPTFDLLEFRDTVTVRKGDYLIPTNQQAIGILIHLLEPKARDSFIHWGLMNIIFERKEYFEMYSMEPIAEKMAESNLQLYEEFTQKVNSDKSFRNNPRERLNFFYKHSPYYDSHYSVYPISKIEASK